MGSSPLVLTKIEPPRPRPGHVPRHALVARLRHGLHRRLNLVAAPAGWGKTSLLAEWLSAEDEAVFAWLTLDENDNDPARFWAYVSAALRKAGVDVPQTFDAAMAAPGRRRRRRRCRCSSTRSSGPSASTCSSWTTTT